MTSGPNDEDIARRGRIVALVIAAGGLLAIFAPVLPGLLALPQRYEFLFYLIALAAFIWSLAVAWQLWQKRK